jgi:hypothetical protein
MSTKQTTLFLILAVAVFGLGYVMTMLVPQEVREERPGMQKEYSETGEYYTIEIDPLPTDIDSRVGEALSRIVEEEIERFREILANVREDEIQRLKEGGRYYSLVIEHRRYDSEKYVSYEFNIYIDTAGAHPNTFYRTAVFDSEGNILLLDDICTSSDCLERISAAAQTQVRRQIVEQAGEWAQDTVITEGLLPHAENFEHFVVDGENLRIFIPPYQAASYAAGSFEVIWPLVESKK